MVRGDSCRLWNRHDAPSLSINFWSGEDCCHSLPREPAVRVEQRIQVFEIPDRKNSPSSDHHYDPNATFLFLMTKEWVFSDPLIRQQDKCLSIPSFSTGSQITLEACNQKDGRQVGNCAPVFNPTIAMYRCSCISAACRGKFSTIKVYRSPFHLLRLPLGCVS